MYIEEVSFFSQNTFNLRVQFLSTLVEIFFSSRRQSAAPLRIPQAWRTATFPFCGTEDDAVDDDGRDLTFRAHAHSKFEYLRKVDSPRALDSLLARL